MQISSEIGFLCHQSKALVLCFPMAPLDILYNNFFWQISIKINRKSTIDFCSYNVTKACSNVQPQRIAKKFLQSIFYAYNCHRALIFLNQDQHMNKNYLLTPFLFTKVFSISKNSRNFFFDPLGKVKKFLNFFNFQ